MPWGWECRAKLVKQLPAKPTERRGMISGEAAEPGPQQYEVPELYCGKGYGHIKRAPAYTFGLNTAIVKTSATPNARMFNIRGMTQKGVDKIPGGVQGAQLEILSDRTRKPGPAAYAPPGDSRYKRPPAFSCQPPARPPYQAWDMWTCPPNMYCPYIPFKKAPAYSIGPSASGLTVPPLPGPGAHDPNFRYQLKSPPAFSFGRPFPPVVPPAYPPPNRYCEKKFTVQKKRAPAPSFGIRHTQYLGELPAQLKPSKLDLMINAGIVFGAKMQDFSGGVIEYDGSSSGASLVSRLREGNNRWLHDPAQEQFSEPALSCTEVCNSSSLHAKKNAYETLTLLKKLPAEARER